MTIRLTSLAANAGLDASEAVGLTLTEIAAAKFAPSGARPALAPGGLLRVRDRKTRSGA